MDLVELGILVAGLATAVFTGMQAMTTILDRIAVDFEYTFRDQPKPGSKAYYVDGDSSKPQHLSVKATVHNRTNKTITLRGLQVTGVPIIFLDIYDKSLVKLIHGGIARDGDIPVAVGGTASISMGIAIDWAKLQSGYVSGVRNHGLRASAIIDRRTLLKRTFSRSASMALQRTQPGFQLVRIILRSGRWRMLILCITTVAFAPQAQRSWPGSRRNEAAAFCHAVS